MVSKPTSPATNDCRHKFSALNNLKGFKNRYNNTFGEPIDFSTGNNSTTNINGFFSPSTNVSRSMML